MLRYVQLKELASHCARGCGCTIDKDRLRLVHTARGMGWATRQCQFRGIPQRQRCRSPAHAAERRALQVRPVRWHAEH